MLASFSPGQKSHTKKNGGCENQYDLLFHSVLQILVTSAPSSEWVQYVLTANQSPYRSRRTSEYTPGIVLVGPIMQPSNLARFTLVYKKIRTLEISVVESCSVNTSVR